MAQLDRLPMFDLFRKEEPALRPLESYEYIQYLEEGGGASKGQLAGKLTDLRIRLTDRDLVTFPSDSFLNVRFQIVQKGTNNPFTVGKIAPVNGGWNLFKRAKYLLANEVAEDVDRPGTIRQVKGLIEYSEDFEQGQGTAELWAPDREDGRIAGEITMVRTADRSVHYKLGATAANPHVVNAVDDPTDGSVIATILNNDLIDLFHNGKKIDVFSGAPGAVSDPVQLLAASAGAATIDYGGIANGDIVEFFVEGRKLQLVGATGVVGAISANATPVLTFIDADNTLIAEFTSRPRGGIDNVGFDSRWKRSISARVGAPYTSDNAYELWMPLRRLFPLLKENEMVMRGIEQELVFDINDPEKMMYRNLATDANVDGEIQLLRLSWWVPVLRPNLVIRNELNQLLNSKAIRSIDWNSTQHYFSEPRTAQESSWLIKTSEHRPVRCYVFFQR